MENKINIAELLKDCPSGMELDCTMIDNVVFEKLDVRSSHHPIIIRRTDSKDSNTTIHLTKYGQYSDEEDYKFVIFPKGKTTWEGFHKPFEDGDIVAFDAHHLQIYIFKDKKENNTLSNCYLMLDAEDDELYLEDSMYYVTRFATEDEKEKLFQAIKNNGYKWNPETKTLEKLPKFKIGDKIVKKGGIRVPILITGVGNTYYWSNTENSTEVLSIAEQDDWELVLNKFDITTLVSFESKVLIRNGDRDIWRPAIFGGYKKNENNEIEYYYALGGTCWRNCIPYEGNEHLCGTTDDCDEFYKN